MIRAPEQFGRKSREALVLPLGISVFDHEVSTLDVTEVTQSLTEGLSQVGVTGPVRYQVAYSSDLGRLLGFDNEWRSEEAQREDSDECDTADQQAATAVWGLSTAAIFCQPSILRNLI